MLALKDLLHRKPPAEASFPAPPLPGAGISAEEWRAFPPLLAVLFNRPEIRATRTEIQYARALRDSGIFRGVPLILPADPDRRRAAEDEALRAFFGRITPEDVAALLRRTADAAPVPTSRRLQMPKRHLTKTMSAALGWAFKKAECAVLWDGGDLDGRAIAGLRRHGAVIAAANLARETREAAFNRAEGQRVKGLGGREVIPIDFLLPLLDEIGRGAQGVKMRACAALAYDFFLRAEEVVNLLVEDLAPFPRREGDKFGVFLPVHKTGSRWKGDAVMCDISAEPIRLWLAHSGLREGVLFPAERGTGSISSNTFRNRLSAAVAATPGLCDLRLDIGPHSFRKSRYNHLAAQPGSDPKYLADLGRWQTKNGLSQTVVKYYNDAQVSTRPALARVADIRKTA